MTKEELAKIREHIEIHSRKESHAIKITQIMKKALEQARRGRNHILKRKMKD